MNFDDWWEKESGWGDGREEKLAEYHLAKDAYELGRRKAYKNGYKSGRKEACKETETIMCILTDMFKADTAWSAYGSGRHIYDHHEWSEAYIKLQKLAKYKGETTVYDSKRDSFDI